MSPSARREPWPFIVGGLLAAMISISLGFFAIAVRHPDPPVVSDAYRAGLEYATELERPGASVAPPPAPRDE